MRDKDERLHRLETDMRKVIGVLRHGMVGGPPFMMKGGGPMIRMLDDYEMCYPAPDFRDRQLESRQSMSKLPAITADTADELNAKTAEAEAKRVRDEAIRTLAAVVKTADERREEARTALKRAKEARRALKSVRGNPDATIEEIHAAIKESGIRY